MPWSHPLGQLPTFLIVLSAFGLGISCTLPLPSPVLCYCILIHNIGSLLPCPIPGTINSVTYSSCLATLSPAWAWVEAHSCRIPSLMGIWIYAIQKTHFRNNDVEAQKDKEATGIRSNKYWKKRSNLPRTLPPGSVFISHNSEAYSWNRPINSPSLTIKENDIWAWCCSIMD